ncbi:MAG TPA: anthranilate synthase component I, partial [Isosphaeraceae bacterium]|nr:anthranilate synthase component I [Isosphaeraceae bacterium]
MPVYRQLTGDGLTPVSAFCRVERSAPSFLFESVIGGEKVGRFSFLGTEPFLSFTARGFEVCIAAIDQPELARTFTSRDPFVDLQALLERYRGFP